MYICLAKSLWEILRLALTCFIRLFTSSVILPYYTKFAFPSIDAIPAGKRRLTAFFEDFIMKEYERFVWTIT